MSDKRTTLDEAVSSIESGMTIGIGGWGSRRKPMAFVRALLRTDVTDLTVVTYGGPDIGLLCSAGKGQEASTTASCRWTRRRSTIRGSPRRAPAARSRPARWTKACCDAACRSAAQRLPFLPIRAGLGSDVRTFWGDELKTVKSPYPTDGGYEELIAMPALNLDAAFVHMNIGDAAGQCRLHGHRPVLRRPVS